MAQLPPTEISDKVVAKAKAHGTLTDADIAALRGLKMQSKLLEPGSDIVRQGDRPDVAVFVLKGMLARYHVAQGGERQYLSFHIEGDMPDVQSLLLAEMDHSVCALDAAEIATIPHGELVKALSRQPGLAFSFWRATLVEAARSRQTITNICTKGHEERIAHLFCEQFYRARECKLVQGRTCRFPITQIQLAQALGMASVSVNRALQSLRQQDLAELRQGELTLPSWKAISTFAGFDPSYLHVSKQSEASQTRFNRLK